MAEDRDALVARAAQLGIRADWVDIWGAQHAVPEASLTALIAELDTPRGRVVLE